MSNSDSCSTVNDSVRVPKHRVEYLKKVWPLLHYEVIDSREIDMAIDHLEDGTAEIALRARSETKDTADVKRCSQFIQAVVLGFLFVEARKFSHVDGLHLTSLHVRGLSSRGLSFVNKQAIKNNVKASVVVNGSTAHIIGSPSDTIHAADFLFQFEKQYPTIFPRFSMFESRYASFRRVKLGFGIHILQTNCYAEF